MAEHYGDRKNFMKPIKIAPLIGRTGTIRAEGGTRSDNPQAPQAV
eukprot:SAG31_NODE_45162_length_260_cov_0.621118_1_plen_44_part_01